ncbi:carbohydrate-binding protein [Streptomyces sp. 3MP-14]|uniref:Carbohydrate-binding protein n=2 Tax=Streptomyces TaxID=1883 RepID=A0A5N6AS69_9ACTN|nr:MULTISPECIES: PQQ-dependent sugar dehydrogenase [Streptomyces]KAB8171015.1 carbohydrate-binding protein [Streptomyces mimosae]KAB8179634.1 carbohydrate-binding protein [Streptomyces sp. 3MP-14]
MTLASAGVVISQQSATAAPPPLEEFQQVELAKGEAEMGEPMSLAVLPDTSVLHTSRDGTLRITDANGSTKVAGQVPVYSHDEEGLQGVGVDPDFEQNRFVYLYYAPPLDTPGGDSPGDGTPEDFAPYDGVNRLSRFVLNEDGTLDNSSEVEILDVAASRGQCCHVGGDIDFDAEGNLYLSTGDDTNPFASDGYSPIDERDGRNPAFDAQRSSGNTNDLRGKVLRIHVEDDGSYTIPEGNLFAEGTEGTRPEIYAMGFRNPFRMSVDKATGTVYVGDYGPDAGAADPNRGPAGQVEFNRITEPGNFGWPYCTGANDAYVDFDFGSGASNGAFNCDAPVNNSPNNTGLTELPPAQPAWIPYDGNSVPEFGGGSESPMAGPVYNYDPDLESNVKFPESMDGTFFATEFGRQWIKAVEQDDSGNVSGIYDFLWEGTQVMDSAFGPDGALYVLDYGLGWFSGDENSALYRIEYTAGTQSPVARASADVTSGPAPLEVNFSSEGSTDPGGAELSYAWDFGDGGTSEDANPTHVFEQAGTYSVELTVTNPSGASGNASVQVAVGNSAPEVNIVLPGDGALVDFGDAVPFEVEVTDAEDEEINCDNVTVTFILGHDSHGHPQTSATGCSGTLQTLADGEHDPNANIFGVWNAEYTDSGAGDAPPLTGSDEVVSQTKQRQAEHFGEGEGPTAIDLGGANGGRAVEVTDGGWISFDPYLLSNATDFTARVSSAGGSGAIEVRAGAPDGEVLGTVEVGDTGGAETYQDVSTALANQPAESTTLYLVFTGGTFNLDDFTFSTGSEE